MTIVCGVCKREDSMISLGYIPREDDQFTTFRQCTVCKTIRSFNIEIPKDFGEPMGEDLSEVEPFCNVLPTGPILGFKRPPNIQNSDTTAKEVAE